MWSKPWLTPLAQVDEQIQAALEQNAVKVIDLFREWDDDKNGVISNVEFRQAMEMLGLDVLPKHVDRLFRKWDPDGSGSITIRELQQMLSPA